MGRMAPPGSPKTSVTPRSSRVRTTDWEPVRFSGDALPGAADGNTLLGVASVDMRVISPLHRKSGWCRRRSARDRAFGCGAHELGELRENATGIARRKRRPAFTAGGQL